LRPVPLREAAKAVLRCDDAYLAELMGRVRDDTRLNEELSKSFRERSPKTHEEVAKWYGDNLVYTGHILGATGLDVTLETLRLEDIEVQVAQLFRHTYRTVLDYGCGTGHRGLKFNNLGYEVWLADVPSLHWDICRKWVELQGRRDVHFIEVGQKFPLGPEEFDVIICFDMLEHVKDPDRVLQHLVQHMDPRGILLLETWFWSNLGKAPYHLEENDKYGRDPRLWQQVLDELGLYPLVSDQAGVTKVWGLKP